MIELISKITDRLARYGAVPPGRAAGLPALALLAAVAAAPVAAEGTPSADGTPPADAPGQIVDELHEKLMYVMQHAGELGYSGRFQELEPLITSRFDTPLIAKVILSRYWDEMDETQRAEFIDLFNRLSVATYASRFDGYNSEQFVEISREELKKGRLLIRTELKRKDDKPVQLDYLMHRDENETWRIISVIANGINDLSLKRAEYATVIRERGYQGLVDDIHQKIREMETGSAG